MRIRLSVRKTIEENATTYFEAAKKAKKKIDGTKQTLTRFEKELPQSQQLVQQATYQKKEWYEQYRWTFSTDDVLIIAGRDAASNESIIKKHALPEDTVLHTDAPGSPFTIIKGEATEATIQQAAQFCAAYSKAWKAGITAADVFWVKADQLSKTANTGEYIQKGSFMVRGEKNYLLPQVQIALGILTGKATAGTLDLFSKHKMNCAVIEPGKEKTSDLAKKLVKKLGLTPDAWVPLIPAGGGQITSWKKFEKQHNP
jgi:predicted ribosome quality control (RQC) complex YloA/Tae2 family protein